MLRALLGSLRLRLVLLVLVAGVPALALILYGYSEERALLVERAEQQTLAVARLVRDDYQHLLQRSHGLLAALARLPEVRSGEAEACGAFLADLMDRFPSYLNLGVTAANGDVVCSAAPLRTPVNLAARPDIRQALTTRTFAIGTYEVSRITGRAALGVAFPVLADGRDIRGAVFADLDVASLGDLVHKTEFPADAVFVLLDAEGRVLAYAPDGSERIDQRLSLVALLRTVVAQTGAGTVHTADVDGQPRVVAATTIDDGDAYVVIGLPEEALLAGANAALRRNLLLLGLVTVLLVLGAWGFGHVFVARQIGAVVHAAERLAAGDFTARTGLGHGPGELGELARAFDDMAATLERHEQELREAQRRLEVAQEHLLRQERLRALGQMASGVVHDFNNALTPMLGFAELLRDRPEMVSAPDKLRAAIEQIITAARDAAEIVARLRAFYRPRDEEEAFTTVDLSALAREALEASQPRWAGEALRRGVEIRVVQEWGELPEVALMPGDVRQALVNLIFNAVDAMPQGGTLTLRTYAGAPRPTTWPLVAYGDLPRPCVVVEVSDTGTGMAADSLARCIEPFFTTKGESGSGLGLASVYGTVERHGGRLEIASAPGEGTTVRLCLPAAQQAQPAPEAAALPARHGPLRILVVDDEAPVRAFLAAALQADGHVVVEAASAREALGVLEREWVDLVVTDHGMPDLLGPELASRVKERWSGVPVVLCTGYSDELPADLPLVAVDEILTKPVHLSALRRALARAMAAIRGEQA